VAKIPTKKLKRGREGKIWPEELVAEFWPNFTKSGRKGAEQNVERKFLILLY
jgi:hypothetical protein